MSKLKDDTAEIQKETQYIKNAVNNMSLAREMLKDYKFYNQILQILLMVSIVSNILIVLMLK